MTRLAAEPTFDDRVRLSTLIKIVAAVFAGVILGLVATIVSLDLEARGTVAGVWRTTPREGSGQIDPYALAANARAGLLPLGEAEGLSLIARNDERGDALDGSCSYALMGPMPPARLWTLSLLDASGFPLQNAAKRYGFTSAEVLRLDKNPLVIAVAPRARSGNWLPVGGRQTFVLMLRLYDTSLTGGGIDIGSVRMPTIKRISCE